MVATLNILSLVVVLLTLGQRERKLRVAILEVDLERDQGLIAVAHLPVKLVDLAAVQQKLAGAPRAVVRPRAHGILRNMQVTQVHLAIIDGGEGIIERDFSLPQGFDLGAEQDDAALVFLEDLVVMPGPAVGSERCFAGRRLLILLALLSHNYGSVVPF